MSLLSNQNLIYVCAITLASMSILHARELLVFRRPEWELKTRSCLIFLKALLLSSPFSSPVFELSSISNSFLFNFVVWYVRFRFNSFLGDYGWMKLLWPLVLLWLTPSFSLASFCNIRYYSVEFNSSVFIFFHPLPNLPLGIYIYSLLTTSLLKFYFEQTQNQNSKTTCVIFFHKNFFLHLFSSYSEG